MSPRIFVRPAQAHNFRGNLQRYVILLPLSILCETFYTLYFWVNDYADILTDDQEASVNEMLKTLEDSIGSQLVILTIDSLGELTIEEYSLQVAQDLQIGRASHDDGVLIMVAIKDRKIRIEVGYGLELVIKNEVADKIIKSIIVPEFRAGNFYRGLTHASSEIINLIYTNHELVGRRGEPKNDGKLQR